jgi:peptidoglycan hydrolase-like protein with peptidoglycan-binding domain
MLRSRYASFVMLLPFLVQGAAAQTSSSSAGGGGQSQREATTASPSKSTAAPAPAGKPSAARPAPPPARVPIRQARPTRDRYREIQQALADAGHYTEAIDGVWGDRSEAAMKRFQKEQGLEPTGKLDALTLIRLGLGPQYESPENTSAVAAPSSL